jgi:hypothetical protein
MAGIGALATQVPGGEFSDFAGAAAHTPTRHEPSAMTLRSPAFDVNCIMRAM